MGIAVFCCICWRSLICVNEQKQTSTTARVQVVSAAFTSAVQRLLIGSWLSSMGQFGASCSFPFAAVPSSRLASRISNLHAYMAPVGSLLNGSFGCGRPGRGLRPCIAQAMPRDASAADSQTRLRGASAQSTSSSTEAPRWKRARSLWGLLWGRFGGGM